MTALVLVQSTANNGYRATSLSFPDCAAVGKTRDEAVANLKQALNARLAEGEIVAVEIGEPEHPWAKWSGIFKDDPTFDDFLAEIEAYRREVDAAEADRAALPP